MFRCIRAPKIQKPVTQARLLGCLLLGKDVERHWVGRAEDLDLVNRELDLTGASRC